MKILEYMSFNPSWFTTVPGMLITGGVVLLLIALIILLTSGSSKKEEVTETNTNSLENNFNNVQEPVQVAVPEAPVMQPVVDTPVQTFDQPVATPQVEIFEPSVAPSFAEPVQQSEMVTPVEITEEPKLEFDIPKVEPIVATPVIEEPVQQPEIVIPVEVKEEPKLEFDIPKVEPIVQQPSQPTVSIYGGASPTANLYNTEPVKPVIYGGADPLENTGSIPKVEIPVAAPIEEAKVVEPIVPEPVVIPTAIVDNQSVGIIPDTSVNEPTIQNVSTEVEEIETLDF